MENNSCIRVFADVKQINNCKKRLNEVKTSVEQLSRALSLAGNEARLNILFLLDKETKMCVCDLSDVLEMKIPAVSQHLRKMKDGGIVTNNKVGQTIFYSINKDYEKLFEPFFELISGNNSKYKNNKIVEVNSFVQKNETNQI